MKRLITLSSLIVILMAAPIGCQTKTVPSVNKVSYASKLSDEPVLVQTFPVAGASDMAVKDAIVKSATVRGWEVTELEGNRIQTHLVHRSSESTLTFEYGNGQVRIYSVSYKIDKNTQNRIEREEPEGWIRNLHKDILENLGLLPTS